MARRSRDDLAVGLRLLAALPRFLRRPMSMDAMRAEVRDRFERREARCLVAIELALAIRGSPYARLFDHAGCTIGDFAEASGRAGVEGALATLFRAGVYLACDEFKARKPVVRGSLAFQVDPATLVNPRSSVHGLAETSSVTRSSSRDRVRRLPVFRATRCCSRRFRRRPVGRPAR